MRQGKSRRISITIFIISIGSRIYGNRGSGAAPPLVLAANVSSFCRRDAVYDYTLDCSGTGCLSAIELLQWLFDPEWAGRYGGMDEPEHQRRFP